MLCGYSLPGHAPITLPVAPDYSVPSPYKLLLEDPEADRILLVEVDPFDPVGDAVVNLRYTDTPVYFTNPYLTRVATAVRYESRIEASNLTLPGTSRSVGEVVVALEQDDAHDFVDYYWDCRDIRVKLGGPDLALTEFGVIQGGKIRGAKWGDSRGERLTFVQQDGTIALEQPLSDSTYAGTGGIEGDSELLGTTRPHAYGICRNITPVRIDQTNRVYQWHDGKSEELTNLFDSGIPYTSGGSTADVFAYTFSASEIENRVYVYDLDNSLVRLAAEPAGLITLDVKGDATVSLGNYVEKAALVAERIARKSGIAAADIDGASVLGTDGRAPYAVGYYQPAGGSATLGQAMSAVMASVWGFVSANREGQIRFGLVGLSSTPAQRTITKVISLETLVAPTVAKSLSLGYQRSWTVQSENDLALNVSATRAAFVGRDIRRLNPSTDEAATGDRLGRKPFEVDTLLDSGLDAVTEQTRRFDLLKALRYQARAIVEHELHQIEAGFEVVLAYPKFGLDGGRRFLVTGVRDDTSTGRTTLDLWG